MATQWMRIHVEQLGAHYSTFSHRRGRNGSLACTVGSTFRDGCDRVGRYITAYGHQVHNDPGAGMKHTTAAFTAFVLIASLLDAQEKLDPKLAVVEQDVLWY